ncbi:hypothetical protein [Frankia sp. BMG5.23]|uniref:hypothetical protein n=1 Tax=Frankia sp. BMG5.23 TaxID=683305 RepID=UPI0004618B53|nr:hypothetical protein [Frankia sp. BMG5.23]KDA44530.1 hypothetical protein BMG523Draft_00707 [Frankia sp. BMG5.23]
MEHVIEPLRGLDWNDIDAVEHATRKALTQLADDPDLIRAALLELPNRPELLALCEHYDILDKIVLYQNDAGIRVRLHVFLPGYFDRPHNHRWSYASRIVRGEYRHYLFGDLDVDAEPEPGSLAALQVRQEQVGDSYALHHSMVHAVVAEPYTVSLVIRGPAVKERFLVMDRGTGEHWWQYGAEQETAGDAARKRMTRERLDELTGLLREWDLF